MQHAALAAKCANLRYLVFSGGGVNVTATLGFLIECREREIPWAFAQQTEGIAGTSVGAFLGAMLIMTKFDTHRTLQAVTQLQQLNLLDMTRITNLFSPQLALVGMEDMLAKFLDPWLELYCHGHKNITLREFFDLTHVWLRITTVDFLAQEPVILDYHSDPDLPLRQAVWASMSIPWIGEPLCYKGRYLVDGGLLCNFDMHAFGAENERYTFGINVEARYTIIMEHIRATLIEATSSTENKTPSAFTHLWAHASLFMSVMMTPLYHLHRIAQKLYNPQQYITITGFATHALSFDSLKQPERLLELGRQACTTWMNKQLVYYIMAILLKHYAVLYPLMTTQQLYSEHNNKEA
jgi:predicted acylesterase/phospholipase RssA